MSLAKQATNLTVVLAADATSANSVEYGITIQNKDISISPEYFAGGAFDESIGGKRISNLRGYRVRINLSFDGSMEKTTKSVGGGSATDSTFREMFNEIASCFSTGQITESVSNQVFSKMSVKIDTSAGSNVIPLSASNATAMGFVPEDMSYSQIYSNQIGRFRPSLTLVAENLMPSIPEELEGVL